MTDGQVFIVCCVLLPWPLMFAVAVLVGKFLKAGRSKPVPRERVVEREWERAS